MLIKENKNKSKANHPQQVLYVDIWNPMTLIYVLLQPIVAPCFVYLPGVCESEIDVDFVELVLCRFVSAETAPSKFQI